MNCTHKIMTATAGTALQLVFLVLIDRQLVAGAQRPIEPMDSIQGPWLYQNYCSKCHGADAKGGSPLVDGRTISGPDLTRYAARRGGKFSLAEIRKVISGEKQISGSHGSKGMPVWGKVFSEVSRDQDLGQVRIDNLARYLRKIQVK